MEHWIRDRPVRWERSWGKMNLPRALMDGRSIVQPAGDEEAQGQVDKVNVLFSCGWPCNAYFPLEPLFVFRDCLPHLALFFVFQYGPPGVHQPGDVTDRIVLNVYNGYNVSRVHGYMLDKFKVRNLMFYYCFNGMSLEPEMWGELHILPLWDWLWEKLIRVYTLYCHFSIITMLKCICKHMLCIAVE